MPLSFPFPPFYRSAQASVDIARGLVQHRLAALLATSFMAAGQAGAAEPQAPTGALWQGELDGHIQVSLTIFPRAGTGGVDGTARYDSMLASAPRQLDGQLTSDGRLSVRERATGQAPVEYPEARDGARFEGTVSSDGLSVSGEWMNTDGSRRQALTLTRKAIYRERTVNVAGARLTERYPETGRPHVDALITSLRASGCGQGEQECRSAIEVMRLDAGNVSLLRTTWRYSGGAHGSLDFVSGTWRRRGPAGAMASAPTAPPVYRRVGLADLLQPGEACLQKLNDELQAALKRQGAAEPARGALDAQALQESRVPFTLYRGGVVLHYAPYAVGPFAQGAYQAAVPFARLGSCARPAGAGRDQSPEPNEKEST
ncbi:RsiV family protein [Cupriavidus sp. YAF13]|uniref:RsiV family protein n=1 Tax=Cupriavidus sp. YAF13 TaxID=3233075 RepID=UPI003F9184B4